MYEYVKDEFILNLFFIYQNHLWEGSKTYPDLWLKHKLCLVTLIPRNPISKGFLSDYFNTHREIFFSVTPITFKKKIHFRSISICDSNDHVKYLFNIFLSLTKNSWQIITSSETLNLTNLAIFSSNIRTLKL